MSFFALGGTNVVFLAIGGTNVDLIEGGTNVVVAVAHMTVGKKSRHHYKDCFRSQKETKTINFRNRLT
jgi:hypothetical protein